MAARGSATAAGVGLAEVEGGRRVDGAACVRLFSCMELQVMDADEFEVGRVGGVVGDGLGEYAVRL